MSAVDRAAEIIRSADGQPDVYRRAAEALAAADPPLLVTDEMCAVLDAAVAHAHSIKGDSWRTALTLDEILARAEKFGEVKREFVAAVDAYLASQQGENP